MNYSLERIVIALVIIVIMVLLTRLTFTCLCYTPHGARIRLRNIKKRYVCFLFLLTVLSIMFLIWSLFGSSLTGTERIILSSLSGAVLLNFYRWKKTPTAESFSFKKTIAYYWPTYSEVVRPETCTPILRDDGAFCFPENTNTRLALSVYKEYLRSIGMKVAKKDTRTRSLSKEARLVYEFSVVGEDGVKLIGEVVFFIKGKNTTIAFGLKS